MAPKLGGSKVSHERCGSGLQGSLSVLFGAASARDYELVETYLACERHASNIPDEVRVTTRGPLWMTQGSLERQHVLFIISSYATVMLAHSKLALILKPKPQLAPYRL